MNYIVKISDKNPVAVVMGGKYDNELFSIVPASEDNDDDVRDVFEQMDITDFMTKRKMMPLAERLEIVESIKRNEKSKYLTKFKDRTKFVIDSGSFILRPTEKTERLFIAGKSGSGKSFLAAMYAREYLDIFPDNNIFLISTHTDEKAYRNIKKNQIPLDENFINNPPELEALRDSLVIFDDTDNLADKKLQNAANLTNNNLIANGRKYGIHVITLSHQLMDFQRTRNLLLEADRVVFFNGGSAYHTQRYLKVYGGFSAQMARKLMNLRSRWVCIGTKIPNYYISENEIGLINDTF